MACFLVEHSINLGCAYSSALNSYLTFCQLHHLDPNPTVNTLSLYITFMAHHIEPRSVCSYLAGIVCESEPSHPSVRQNRYSPLVVRTQAPCGASPILCSKNHHILEMISNISIIISQDLCFMTISCSSPSSLWALLTCDAWGSLCSLTPALFVPQPRPHGGMMSVSTRLPSPS